MTELTLSGIGVLYSILALILGIVAVIFGLRIYYKKLSNEKRSEAMAGKHLPKGLQSRNKYKELDVFSISRPIWMFGLGTAMMLSISAFSWVSTQNDIYIPAGALDTDDEWEVTRTPPPAPKLPPPPPPPPVVIQAVEDLPIEDQPTFESMEIDVDTEIVDVEPVVDIPAPTAPAPPPIIEEVEEMDFIVVEEMPRFPGCEDIDGTKADKQACAEQKMLEFIYSNVKYPSSAREIGIEGMAVLQFVVDKTGNIIKTNIVRDIAGGCGAEAFRVVNKMPKWIPGKQRGREVNVLYTLPIKFVLQN